MRFDIFAFGHDFSCKIINHVSSPNYITNNFQVAHKKFYKKMFKIFIISYFLSNLNSYEIFMEADFTYDWNIKNVRIVEYYSTHFLPKKEK